jgi:hypothetical protein
MNFLFHFWSSFQPVFLGKRDGMHSGTFTLALVIMAIWLHETTKRLLDSLLTWSWSLCQVESSSTWSSRHYKLCVHLWSEPCCPTTWCEESAQRNTATCSTLWILYSCSDTLMDGEVESGFLHSYFDYKA